MSRTPYAAQTFIAQVKALRKSAKVETGDTDGFDVDRSITFDKATSKWLHPAMDYIDDDRIIGYAVTKDQLTILFSHRSTEADNRDPFLIEDAVTVAEAERG